MVWVKEGPISFLRGLVYTLRILPHERPMGYSSVKLKLEQVVPKNKNREKVLEQGL